MKFLRDMTKQAADEFKDLADEVWDAMGSTEGAPEYVRKAGKTMGKYALTAQLVMMLNFPEDAQMLRDSFNATGQGPTGSKEFGGPMGTILDNTADMAERTHGQAMDLQGFADISSTSTFDDLHKFLPMLSTVAEEAEKRGKK